MRSGINFSRSATALVVVLVLSVGAFADTVRLKDGSVVKGRIVSFGGGKFVVAIGSGTRRKEMTFTAGEVDSIQFDQDAGSQTASNRNAQPVENASYSPEPAQPKVVIRDAAGPAAVRNAPSTTTKAAAAPVTKADIPVRTAPSGARPIEIAVNVLADNTANGWTNSGFVVKRGQKIRITGDGQISLGGGKMTGPSGSYEIEDASKLLKSVPTGALIAVIGDDNNDFIYVGGSREFTATRDGALFLGVNEGNLNDNAGKFAVKVEIDPDSGV